MSETRTADGALLPLIERRKIYQKRWYDRNREQERLRAEVKNRKKYGLPEPTRPRPEHCECCGGKNGDGRVLSLDHCHKTGAFRGWLCAKCNLGIGKLGDTREALERAVAYLKRCES